MFFLAQIKENNPTDTNEITTNFKNPHLDILSSQKKSQPVNKSTFMLELKQGISIEESCKRVHAKIDHLWNE